MACPRYRRPLSLPLLVLALGLPACGGDDDDGAAFPGVSRWKCYADATTGTCDCHGLGPSSDVVVGGTGISEVSSCAGYATCATYRDELDDWMCSCGADGFTPLAGANDVTAAASCPP